MRWRDDLIHHFGPAWPRAAQDRYRWKQSREGFPLVGREHNPSLSSVQVNMTCWLCNCELGRQLNHTRELSLGHVPTEQGEPRFVGPVRRHHFNLLAFGFDNYQELGGLSRDNSLYYLDLKNMMQSCSMKRTVNYEIGYLPVTQYEGCMLQSSARAFWHTCVQVQPLFELHV